MAKALYWKAKGPLKTGKGDIWYDQEIPDDLQRDLGSDRIAQLRRKGKIGDKTDAEIAAKARSKAARAAKKALSETSETKPEKPGAKL